MIDKTKVLVSHWKKNIYIVSKHRKVLLAIIIVAKFKCNARSDWLEQSALSENREQLVDIRLGF